MLEPYLSRWKNEWISFIDIIRAQMRSRMSLFFSTKLFFLFTKLYACLVHSKPNELLNKWVPVYNSYTLILFWLFLNDHHHKQHQQQQNQTICQRMWLSVMSWDYCGGWEEGENAVKERLQQIHLSCPCDYLSYLQVCRLDLGTVKDLCFRTFRPDTQHH